MARRKGTLPLLLNVPLKVEPVIITGAPETKWITVTPQLASKWLEETNTNNRTVKEAHAHRLATDMAEGRWQGRNGEPIRFDTEGRLVDGQHRLWASVISDCSFDTLLVTGIDPDSYSTIGIGATKGLGDFLGPVLEEKAVVSLSAAIRIIWFWQRGELADFRNSKMQPSTETLMQFFRDNQEIRESVHAVMHIPGIRGVINTTYASLIHYTAVKYRRRPTAEEFLNRLSDGVELSKDSPIYHLRKFLLLQRVKNARRASSVYVLHLVIKCWNTYKAGLPLGHLKVAVNEEFPKL